MKSKSASLPAPVGGWNARDSLGEMPPVDAASLINWFPATTDVMVRKGYSKWATGLTGQVETIITYDGGPNSKLFGSTSAGDIYDVSAGGAVGAASVTGLSTGRIEYTNISTQGGNFLLCVNGANKLNGFDGSVWWGDGDGSHDITGFDTSTASNIGLFKNRIWFLKKNTLDAYYLPTLSIAGAAQYFPLSAVANNGGYLVDIATWTIDAGYGVDDMLAFVTSEGEVIVYRGTDPASLNTWGLVGIWELGAPVGKRCFMKYAGDLLLIGQDGLTPMSAALQSSRTNPKVALTDKIQFAVSEAVTTYGTNFGWETLYYPKQNMLILNVPTQEGMSQEQYVMNTITRNWCRFQGWNANCWALYNDDPYFGASGYVGKAWDTFSDNGTDINAVAAQAFNYFNSRGLIKRFTMMRPILFTNGQPAIFGNINIDFDFSTTYAPLSILPAPVGGTWDSAVWDTSVWGNTLTPSKYWQGVTGMGYAGGVGLQTAINGIECHWVSTDVVYEVGAVL